MIMKQKIENKNFYDVVGTHIVNTEIIRAFNPDGAPLTGRVRKNKSLYIPDTSDVPNTSRMYAKGISPEWLIKKARWAIGEATRYGLGEGGMDPEQLFPASERNACDCSGFICWVLGLSRKTDIGFYQKFGGWIYTDSIEADMLSNTGIFELLQKPEPGCIVVYGAGNKIGHVGIVSEALDGKMKKVIHCSKGNYTTYKDAIRETEPTVFDRKDVLWGRYCEVAK